MRSEPWYEDFAQKCGRAFPIFESPLAAVTAARALTGWEGRSERWAFRGQADYSWSFATTAERGSSIEAKHGVALKPTARGELLRRQFADFLKQSANPLIRGIVNSERQIEALAQHHGLPSNLLDFSYNPYVGMFFAAKPSGTSLIGCLYCINITEHLDFVNPYRVFLENGTARNIPSVEVARQRHPEMAMPDCLPVKMPDWERRIAKQEGLFLDGSNLRRAFENVIDRYYFRQGLYEIDAAFSGIDMKTLFDDEQWLQDIISAFVEAHLKRL